MKVSLKISFKNIIKVKKTLYEYYINESESK